MLLILLLVAVALVATACHDLAQRKHAILRNYPIVGHFRYWLESVGPELRQYIVTDSNEERPFSRDQSPDRDSRRTVRIAHGGEPARWTRPWRGLR